MIYRLANAINGIFAFALSPLIDPECPDHLTSAPGCINSQCSPSRYSVTGTPARQSVPQHQRVHISRQQTRRRVVTHQVPVRTKRLTPYQVLGLPSGSSPRQVKKAYRQLTRTHHPDTGDGNTERLFAVKAAKEELIG